MKAFMLNCMRISGRSARQRLCAKNPLLRILHRWGARCQKCAQSLHSKTFHYSHAKDDGQSGLCSETSMQDDSRWGKCMPHQYADLGWATGSHPCEGGATGSHPSHCVTHLTPQTRTRGVKQVAGNDTCKHDSGSQDRHAAVTLHACMTSTSTAGRRRVT